MRADRLLSILMLLQIHRRMTARDLAGRLEVSERTIHRDMESLSSTGVPVTGERGAGGGWSLPEGYQTNLTGLTQSEIQALFVATPFRVLSDLGLGDASKAALIKLQAALPATTRRDAAFVRQLIHVDAAGWQRSGEDVSLLPILQDAIWQERKLSMVYQRNDGPGSERLVEPMGLVAKGSVWYLVAGVDGDFRTYRVSRIQSANVTEQPFRRPDDFDLKAHWEQAAAAFAANLPRYLCIVRAAPEIVHKLRYGGRFAKFQGFGEPDADGWVQVTIQFDMPEEAREYALSFGSRLEVLEPADLREQVIKMAHDILDFYASRPLP